MQINLIWAQAHNRVIGINGTMPWHIPEDLAHFKRTTLGAPVIMGRKTWDSLPERFRPLPGRLNIVISRQPDFLAGHTGIGLQAVTSLQAALAMASQQSGLADVWLIGGAQMYAQALPLANQVIVTEIDAHFAGDAYAPQLGSEWREAARESHLTASGLPIAFVTYLKAPQDDAGFMQFATWNVNSLTVRLPQVIDWLAANPVDVLALQELKMTDDKFPLQALLDVGYQASFFGQKTYNGVALLTKLPVANVVKNIPDFPDPQARVIAATVPSALGDIRVVNAYFVNGHAPGTDKFDYKMRWLRGMRDYLRAELAAHPRVVVMGDFNITFDAADSWDPDGLQETIHHTTEERDHLKALLALGFSDTHRQCHPNPSSVKAQKTFSWWDYRDFGFKRNRGLRIDYVLVSDALKPKVVSCEIDTTPRKNERPSDHTPVVMELHL